MSDLSRYRNKTKKIEALRSRMIALSDDELKAKTDEFRTRLNNGEKEDDILIEVFAVVREATRRVLGLEHYPVQLMGGIALYEGKIAEMKTGEGKTQTCLMPAYLNALSGKGVHVVTVNDYLAKRDAEEMGKVHNFLGLSVGCVLANMTTDQRKEQYNCDITYVTNSEAGFDYLRDNMATTMEARVQRGLHYVIIDEVDSILIDEARTPLIISNKGNIPSSFYISCDSVAKKLRKGEKRDKDKWEETDETGDYIVDEKEKTALLTDRGVKRVEKAFGIKNYSDLENSNIQHGMIMALKANAIMHNGKDYIVRDGKVEIVDEFTGRILDGRRFSDGLHQAIEAKEGVEVLSESITMATITYQHFFNKYEKRAGMTGTAMTEKNEFKDIYKLGVVEIPTNRPVIRKDLNDKVYRTKKEKYHEVLEEIVRAKDRNQPVLVGTTTVETSELLSKMLKNRGIKHQVLNAKYHEKEAEIISHAGEAGTITIATNMAGRGTDIKLDEQARNAGGLLVIGTERHEARRIDNQLRGRSGRQGDPGCSIFFLSLEDDIIAKYGKQQVIERVKNSNLPINQPLEGGFLSKAIENAQKRIEAQHYNTRKSLLDYDTVNNEQRELIYAERDRIIKGEKLDDVILRMAKKQATLVATKYANDDASYYEYIKRIFWKNTDMNECKTPSEKMNKAMEIAENGFEEARRKFPNDEVFNNFVRSIFLSTLDRRWIAHIDNLTHLREGVTMQAYGQRDPKVEYRNSAYMAFDEMLNRVGASVISIIYGAQVSTGVATKGSHGLKVMGTVKKSGTQKAE